ncbi:hypothetical protein [Streptomyces lavendulae]|uniref:hypothetical protein n=1 Tax=Streptomyces lavendulae TaxID=1914 RepID=UPI0036E687B7
MMRRFAALLLALTALLGVSVSAPQPAAAVDGPISNGIRWLCEAGRSLSLGLIPDGKKGNPKAAGNCRVLGDVVEATAHQEWDKISDSLVGDLIKSGEGVAKWSIRKVLTLGLGGASLDLRSTRLWDSENPSPLAGMLVWLGLVIAAGGVMWQLAKMAVTGEVKHLGRAAVGWGENLVLSFLGVSLFALLLKLGDEMTTGLVDATFNQKEGYERIIAVMVPAGAMNPVAVAGIVGVLLLVGIIQMVMVFLRLSAIPIICLLLPVAGAGRTGGETTRKWAPGLITSGLVVIAYKPILAIIICIGFAEFGNSSGLSEWLRGAATLVLAIVAPGPLTRIFAPFGAAVGGGLAAGGASGALGAAAGFLGRRNGHEGGEGEAPDSPVAHARRVARSMDSGGDDPPPPPPPSGGGIPMLPAPGGPSAGSPRGGTDSPGREEQGGQMPAEASRVPAQPGVMPSAVPATSSTGAAVPGPAAAIGIGIQVMDGVNDVVQQASGEVGGGSGK